MLGLLLRESGVGCVDGMVDPDGSRACDWPTTRRIAGDWAGRQSAWWTTRSEWRTAGECPRSASNRGTC